LLLATVFVLEASAVRARPLYHDLQLFALPEPAAHLDVTAGWSVQYLVRDVLTYSRLNNVVSTCVNLQNNDSRTVSLVVLSIALYDAKKTFLKSFEHFRHGDILPNAEALSPNSPRDTGNLTNCWTSHPLGWDKILEPTAIGVVSLKRIEYTDGTTWVAQERTSEFPPGDRLVALQQGPPMRATRK